MERKKATFKYIFIPEINLRWGRRLQKIRKIKTEEKTKGKRQGWEQKFEKGTREWQRQ